MEVLYTRDPLTHGGDCDYCDEVPSWVLNVPLVSALAKIPTCLHPETGTDMVAIIVACPERFPYETGYPRRVQVGLAVSMSQGHNDGANVRVLTFDDVTVENVQAPTWLQFSVGGTQGLWAHRDIKGSDAFHTWCDRQLQASLQRA